MPKQDRAIIRRLTRTDQPGEHLLVQITSHGSQPLDLKLVGTDQEHLYHGSTIERDVASYHASGYGGSLAEWKDTLAYVILQQQPSGDGSLPKYLHEVEMVASIKGTVFTLTIRKNVGGITQKLGEIRLTQDDEREEVAAFEWVDAAVATSDELRDQLAKLQASALQQREEVTRLNSQLDDLVAAKKAHDEEMLGKFVALLNAKKLKIRDQQRLLDGAKVDPKRAKEVVSARQSSTATPAAVAAATSKGRKPAPSRRGKRKAAAPAGPASDAEDEDAEMADAGPELESTAAHRNDTDEDTDDVPTAMTPDHSDTETDATDDDIDASIAEAAAAASQSQSQRQTRRSAAASQADSQPATSSQTQSQSQKTKVETIPPRRALPFNQKAKKKEVEAPAPTPLPPQSQHDDGEETDTDDEL